MGCNCSGWPDADMAESEIVMVEVPEGVTIGGGGGATDAVPPPPQPARMNGMQKIVAERIARRAWRLLRAGWRARQFSL